MILLLLALSACGSRTKNEDQMALEFRNHYLEMQTIEGSAAICADYGERVYDYEIDFSWRDDGETVLTLTAPEEVAGMTARIAGGESYLLFDGEQLETGPLSPDGLSPIDCIPALLHYIFSGYIAECGRETLDGLECLRVQYRQPEAQRGSGLEALLWFALPDGALHRAELQQDGFTVLYVEISAWSADAAALP